MVYQTLSARCQELERLKTEWSEHSAKLSGEHSAQLTAERERALAGQTEAQARHEREKRELEQSHAVKVGISLASKFDLSCTNVITVFSSILSSSSTGAQVFLKFYSGFFWKMTLRFRATSSACVLWSSGYWR